MSDQRAAGGRSPRFRRRSCLVWLAAVVLIALAGGLLVGELGSRAELAPLDDARRWTGHHNLDVATALARAPDGGVWVGTRGAGLVRWDADGDAYHRHLADQLQGRRVTDLAVTDQGVVWAAARPVAVDPRVDSASRVVRYDDGATATYTVADGLPGGRVSALAVDGDGVVWAATGTGLARFDGRRWATVAVPGVPGGVDHLAVDDEGALWAATGHVSPDDGGQDDASPGGRVARFDGEAWRTWRAGGALPAGRVTALTAGGDGSVWVATIDRVGDADVRRRLVRFAGGGWRARARDVELSGPALHTVAVDDDGAVWLAAFDATPARGAAGVARLADGETATYTTDDGLPHGDVSSLVTGRNGAVWAVTSRGVARFGNGRWHAYTTGTGPAAGAVASLAVTDDGVWAASTAGVSRFDGQQWTRWRVGRDRPVPVAAGTLAVGPDNGVWYARQDLWRVDGSAWSQVPRSPQQDLAAVAVADDGTAWTATDSRAAGDESRVIRHRGDRRTVFTPEDGLAYGQVADLEIGVGGTVWAATSSGVSRFADGRWTTFTPADGLPSYEVTALAASERLDAVWAATTRGLARFDGEQWATPATAGDPLEPAAGPPKRREVAAIALDQRGNVWAVAADGEVARFDGQHWTSTTELPTHRIHALAVSGDAVWLGTATGALRFDRR